MSSPMALGTFRLRFGLLVLLLTVGPAAHAASSVLSPETSCALAELRGAPNEAVRLAQAHRLAAMGAEGLNLLVRLTQSRQPAIRLAAALGLAAGADPTVEGALGALLDDPETSIVQAAAQGLARMGPTGLEHVRLALAGNAAAAADRALAVVSGFPARPDEGFARLLEAYLERDEPELLKWSLHAAARCRRPALVPLAARHLVSGEPDVAQAALLAVDALLDAPGVAELTDLLEHPDPYIRDFALVAVRLRRPVSTEFEPATSRPEWPALGRRLETALADPHPLLRLDAVRALDSWVGNSYGFREESEWVHLIARRLQAEPDAVVRQGMVEFLAGSTRRDIELGSLGLHWDLPPSSRSLIADSLDGVVIPALLASLEDPSEDVQIAGARWLQHVTGLGPEGGGWRAADVQARAELDQAWSGWWAERAALDPDERTRRALRAALTALESGGEPEAWRPGLRLVLGLKPPSSAEIAPWLRSWLHENESGTRLQWLAKAIKGRPFGRVDPWSWQRLSRLAGTSLAPLVLLEPASRERLLIALLAGQATPSLPHPCEPDAPRPIPFACELRATDSELVTKIGAGLFDGWSEAAQTASRRTVEARPESAAAWYFEALVLSLSPAPDLDAERKALREAARLGSSPLRGSAELRLARLDGLEGRDRDARRRLRRVLRESQSGDLRSRASLALGLLELDAGRHRRARQHLERAQLNAPEHLAWQADVALAFLDERADLALVLVDEALGAEPAWPLALRLRAKALSKLGRDAEAETTEDRATTLDWLGQSTRGSEDELRERLAAVELLLSELPPSGWLEARSGRLALALGRRAQALPALERALALGNWEPETGRVTLTQFEEAGRHEDAVRLLVELRQAWPEHRTQFTRAARRSVAAALHHARRELAP